MTAKKTRCAAVVLVVATLATLEGQAPSKELIAEAAQLAATEAKPIDDFRASAAYRRQLIQTLTRRVVERSVEIANER